VDGELTSSATCADAREAEEIGSTESIIGDSHLVSFPFSRGFCIGVPDTVLLGALILGESGFL